MNRRSFQGFVMWAAVCAACVACGSGKIGPVWDISRPVSASYVAGETPYDGRVQVIAFNIERGFFREDVVRYVEEMRARVPATIVLLTECDRNHSRTGDVFVADEIARALGMDMVFVTEYIEYNDETTDTQGDHGNAILSPFPITDLAVIRHLTTYDWEKAGSIMGQPRHGDRVTLGATVELPGGDRVRVYAVHLESNTGTIGKWLQMRQVLEDADKTELPTMIGGDFNELPLGLMFEMFPLHGIENAFKGDFSPTGTCKPAGDRARCSLKIDWIVYRNAGMVERSVDYPLNAEGGVISDHAPVRAVFRLD